MVPPMHEIVTIANDYFARHQSHAMMLIDDQISRAVGKYQWSDVLKWQRVRQRVRRLESVAPRPRAVAAVADPVEL